MGGGKSRRRSMWMGNINVISAHDDFRFHSPSEKPLSRPSQGRNLLPFRHRRLSSDICRIWKSSCFTRSDMSISVSPNYPMQVSLCATLLSLRPSSPPHPLHESIPLDPPPKR